MSIQSSIDASTTVFQALSMVPAAVPPFPKVVSADAIRRIIIEQSMRAGVGHIGSALSVADVIAALYGDIMRIEAPNDPNRDRFVLSKGHAALALYAALHLRGWLSAEELNSFCGNDSNLGVHPEHDLAGVEFSTGSLGQGLSYGVGLALAAKRQNSQRKIFVLLSDAECNEGSVWESAMFAAHHKLDNLFVVVDDNAQQAFGYTDEVLNPSPLAYRWQAFGWKAVTIDGHDREQLVDTFAGFEHSYGRPHAVLAKTIFGKGISFMERELKWHYLPLSQADYARALLELGEAE